MTSPSLHYPGSRGSVILRGQMPDLSPRPRPDLARALLPGTRRGNTGPEGTRRSLQPPQRRARGGPGPGGPRQATLAGCGRGSRYVTAQSAGSARGQPGFHYITRAAALQTPLQVIGCRAALPANSTRLCKSSLSQRFLWLRRMQTDVIAWVGVAWAGGNEGVWKFAAGLVWRLGIPDLFQPVQSRGGTECD